MRTARQHRGEKSSRRATRTTEADALERGPRRVLLDAVALGALAGDVFLSDPRRPSTDLARAEYLGRVTLNWSLEKPPLRDVARRSVEEMADLGRSIAAAIESTSAISGFRGRDSAPRGASVELWRGISDFCAHAHARSLELEDVVELMSRHVTLVGALHDLSPGLLIDPRFRMFYVLRGHEIEEPGRGRLFALLVGRMTERWRPGGRVRQELAAQAREHEVLVTDLKRGVMHRSLAGVGGRLWRADEALLLSACRRAESELGDRKSVV